MAVAIIAEYNPFHYGHARQLAEARKKWPNEKIVIFLSGNFVQRGDFAIEAFSKRKKTALSYGADKVYKLPFYISTQAAHIFARESIKLIAKKKIDKIFFGINKLDATKLFKIAKLLYANIDKYNEIIKKQLKKGFSFPKAAAHALYSVTKAKVEFSNDILGFEYCKAIVENNYPIKAFSIKRNDGEDEKFVSASIIREKFWNGEDVSKWTPMKLRRQKAKRIEDFYHKFQNLVTKWPKNKLKRIKLMSEGMENLFKKHIDAKSFEEFIDRTSSKRYTHSRIRRVMLNVILKKFS